jgi:hypothetical protein
MYIYAYDKAFTGSALTIDDDEANACMNIYLPIHIYLHIYMYAYTHMKMYLPVQYYPQIVVMRRMHV